MDVIAIILKVIVGLSILNVWLIQPKRPTKWRGGDANTILEEFKVYGLPAWSCYVIGALKVLLALVLILSIWFLALEKWSALGLAFLLTGSIIMHIKIKDPLYKSVPAALFLLMCLCIAFSNHLI